MDGYTEDGEIYGRTQWVSAGGRGAGRPAAARAARGWPHGAALLPPYPPPRRPSRLRSPLPHAARPAGRARHRPHRLPAGARGRQRAGAAGGGPDAALPRAGHLHLRPGGHARGLSGPSAATWRPQRWRPQRAGGLNAAGRLQRAGGLKRRRRRRHARRSHAAAAGGACRPAPRGCSEGLFTCAPDPYMCPYTRTRLPSSRLANLDTHVARLDRSAPGSGIGPHKGACWAPCLLMPVSLACGAATCLHTYWISFSRSPGPGSG